MSSSVYENPVRTYSTDAWVSLKKTRTQVSEKKKRNLWGETNSMPTFIDNPSAMTNPTIVKLTLRTKGEVMEQVQRKLETAKKM